MHRFHEVRARATATSARALGKRTGSQAARARLVAPRTALAMDEAVAALRVGDIFGHGEARSRTRQPRLQARPSEANETARARNRMTRGTLGPDHKLGLADDAQAASLEHAINMPWETARRRRRGPADRLGSKDSIGGYLLMHSGNVRALRIDKGKRRWNWPGDCNVWQGACIGTTAPRPGDLVRRAWSHPPCRVIRRHLAGCLHERT